MIASIRKNFSTLVIGTAIYGAGFGVLYIGGTESFKNCMASSSPSSLCFPVAVGETIVKAQKKVENRVKENGNSVFRAAYSLL